MPNCCVEVNQSEAERPDETELVQSAEDSADEERWYHVERYQAEMLAEAIEEAEGRVVTARMCRRPW